MNRSPASRLSVALAGAGISLFAATIARAQDPVVVPADTLAVDSLGAIPPDPFLTDSLDVGIPPDSLLGQVPGVARGSGDFPWLVELSGWRGFSIEHYNRVDGLTPSWGLELAPVEPATHPSLAGRVAVATTHSQLYWSASIRQRLPLPGAFHLNAEYFNRSATFDGWKLSTRENDLSTVIFASDLFDWWLDKGYTVGIDAERSDGGLGGGVEFLDASQRTQEDRSPFALFGSIARGEGSDSSDIDLLVELQPKTFDAYMDVKLFLERTLGHKVDLVLAEAVKPRLRPMILAEAVRASRL